MRLEALRQPEISLNEETSLEMEKKRKDAKHIYEKQKQIYSVAEHEKHPPETYHGSAEEAWNQRETTASRKLLWEQMRANEQQEQTPADESNQVLTGSNKVENGNMVKEGEQQV
ncbi:unnamed protein product [Linum trigynum]|uniref:Uncharacterized protein n=1 Tax=Linum trigynum TaxID=586398 RepID=A0AAV2G6D2_9ROSI